MRTGWTPFQLLRSSCPLLAPPQQQEVEQRPSGPNERNRATKTDEEKEKTSATVEAHKVDEERTKKAAE